MMLVGMIAAVVAFAPRTAAAKDACIHTAALSGWTFVLKNARLSAGSTGAIQGYAIRDDGFAEPISGGYIVFPGTIYAGITRYLTGLSSRT
jgi:hypothetical protein